MDSHTEAIIASVKKKIRLATKYLDEARSELKQLEPPGAADPKPSKRRGAENLGSGNKSDEWFHVDDVRCKGSTAKAVLAVLPDGREEWFPKSHVSSDSEVVEEGDEGTLIVSEWIATEKELT